MNARVEGLMMLMRFFLQNQTQGHGHNPSAPTQIWGLDLRRVLGLIRLGVTLTLIHVSKLLLHLVINGTLTRNFIVTTLTKIKKTINKKIKLPFKVNVDLEFCNLELTRMRG